MSYKSVLFDCKCCFIKKYFYSNIIYMNFDCVCLCMFSRLPRHSICDNNDKWTGALIFPSKIKMFYIIYWLISYFLFLFFRKCIPSFFIAHSIIIKFDDNDLFTKLIANLVTLVCSLCNLTLVPADKYCKGDDTI